MGPPGSGKGTQSQLLSEKLNFYYFETSKIIEQNFNNAKEGEFIEVDGEKYDLLHEKKLFAEGILCTPVLVTYLVKEKIKELAKEGKGIVFSGSPRTIYEGEQIMPFLDELYGKENIEIILIKLPEKESIFRNTHRRFCSLMRHPILYSKETEKLTRCPLDGSELVVRILDTTETMKIRLKEYKERTLPLIDYFKRENFIAKEIEGKQTPEELHNDILKILQ